MTIRVPNSKQNDEALRVLAQMYARWFLRATIISVGDGYEQIRDIFSAAVSQQDAYAQLTQGAQALSDEESDLRRAFEHARESVAQVIQTGGGVEALVIGETDGYRHLCLSCSQDEQNFQLVRFFQRQERRILLKPEVEGERRSAYAKCQLCLQPLNPNKLVLFTFAGTQKHPSACPCGTCNRAGIASLLTIYACEKDTQQVLFPPLHQVAAASKPRCVEEAVKVCWERGWYMFNKDSVLA